MFIRDKEKETPDNLDNNSGLLSGPTGDTSVATTSGPTSNTDVGTTFVPPSHCDVFLSGPQNLLLNYTYLFPDSNYFLTTPCNV